MELKSVINSYLEEVISFYSLWSKINWRHLQFAIFSIAYRKEGIRNSYQLRVKNRGVEIETAGTLERKS